MDSTQQQSGTSKFDPTRFGIYQSFRVYGDSVGGGALLNTRAWNRAVESGEPVGDCRVCGWHIVGCPTEIVGTVTWYTAVCTNPPCRHEVASPNGEILRKSSRHSEMPSGFWTGRPGTKAKAHA